MGGGASVPEEDANRIKDLFTLLDLDANGELNRNELYEFCLQSPKLQISGGAESLILSCDENENGGVSLDEWMGMWKRELKEGGTEGLREQVKWFQEVAEEAQHIREKMLYARIDIKGDALLTKQEILDIVDKSPLLDNAFTKVTDYMEDGVISLESWLKMWDLIQKGNSVQDFMECIRWAEGLAVEVELDRQQRVFNILDHDGNKFLELPELMGFCSDLSKFSTNGSQSKFIQPGGAQALLRECDHDGNGKVSMKEWMQMWRDHRWEDGSYSMSTMLLWFDCVAEASRKSHEREEEGSAFLMNTKRFEAKFRRCSELCVNWADLKKISQVSNAVINEESADIPLENVPDAAATKPADSPNPGECAQSDETAADQSKAAVSKKTAKDDSGSSSANDEAAKE